MKKNIVSILLAISLLLSHSVIKVSAEDALTVDSLDKHTYEEDTEDNFDEITEEDSRKDKLYEDDSSKEEDTDNEVPEEFLEPDLGVTDRSTQEGIIEPLQNDSWALNGRWMLNGTGWWYAYEDGTWPADVIVEINGERYAFDIHGYMITGWYQNGEGWFYFGENGVMHQGWMLSGNIWYYLDGTDTACPGRMVSDGQRIIGGERYMFSASGGMLVGWVLCPEGWYYTDKDGAICNGWISLGKEKYYLDSYNEEYPGLMACESWKEIDGESYYLTESGAMASGWLLRPEGWYYLGSDGARKYGWQLIGGSWYYFYQENDQNGGPSGVMAVSQIIDGWDITESGIAVNDIQGKIEEIKKYISVPYSYGGNTTKGWDCSGFTQWALSYIGVSIPRTSSQQARGGVSVDKENMELWKAGDILVYSSGGSYNHVALYLGDGLIMHALNAKYGTLIQGVDVYEKMDKNNSLALVRRYL